jgi:peptidyl-prolyl cis-trans isomerase A (cyclophilin A)
VKTFAFYFVVSCAVLSPSAQAQKFMQLALAKKELFATLTTSKGDIVLRLHSKETPKSVALFVGLASGEREFTDFKTGAPAKRPYYDGTVFHRVLEHFMIQGGDPTGTGSGNAGFVFNDEIDETQKFDRPFLLAMANQGPNTNGGQFFITTAAAKHLNGKHTIFGEVISGKEVVTAIERAPKNPRDKSQLLQPVTVLSVTIGLKSSAP